MKTIYLFGVIDNCEDCISATSIADSIQQLDKNEQLEIYINSPGGSVFEGLAIYNLLSELNPKPQIKIIGEASSIASVIACAGNVSMADTALMLIHNPWTVGWVVDEDYINQINKELTTIKSSILIAYGRKTGLPTAQLSDLMNKGEYLTSQQCLEMGLIDQIYTPGGVETAFTHDSTKKDSSIRKVLNQVKIFNHSQGNIMPATPEDSNLQNSMLKANNDSLLKDKEKLTALNEKLQSDYSNISNQLNTMKIANEQLQTEHQDMIEKFKNVQNQLFRAEEQGFVDQLLAQGKVTQSEILGNAKENELPDMVNLLLQLRNSNSEAYKLYRNQLEKRTSKTYLKDELTENIEALQEDTLVNYVKAKNMRGK
jgi:ATP-dependent Clp protease, protease subunit